VLVDPAMLAEMKNPRNKMLTRASNQKFNLQPLFWQTKKASSQNNATLFFRK
jgi:hypothetical protein